jgi:hypothetical protein
MEEERKEDRERGRESKWEAGRKQKQIIILLSMAVYACNPSTWEAEAR